jgi:hypothetical protein
MNIYSLLTGNSRSWMSLYLQKNNHALAISMLERLQAIGNSVSTVINKTGATKEPPALFVTAITQFIEDFLFFFCKEDFVIPPILQANFVYFNSLLSNLITISEFRSTDTAIKLLLQRQFKQASKLCMLLSARNTVQLDPSSIFDASPHLASLWYCNYLSLYQSGLSDKDTFQRLKSLLCFQDPRFIPVSNIAEVYYGSTYIDPDNDRFIKQLINNACKIFERDTFNEESNSKSIGIIASCLLQGHAVYRNQKAFIEALQTIADVTLYALHPGQDSKLCSNIVPMYNSKLNEAINTIKSKKHRLIYFTEIGMHPSSIFLANLRLAPIQVTTYGHSVSTWGAEIDYFIVSDDVEDHEELANNYSESILSVSGFGVIHEPAPQKIDSCLSSDREQIVIACPWSAHKTNYLLISVLERLIHKFQKPIIFRFLTGPLILRDYGLLPFMEILHKRLAPAKVEIYTDGDYIAYLQVIADSDFCLDSFHFGGCNSVFDSLVCGRPIVTRQGSKWYNRIGSAMLQAIGLSELVARSENEYEEKALKLIDDIEWRLALTKKIRAIDLTLAPFCDRSQASAFRNKIADLLDINRINLNQSAPCSI